MASDHTKLNSNEARLLWKLASGPFLSSDIDLRSSLYEARPTLVSLGFAEWAGEDSTSILRITDDGRAALRSIESACRKTSM
jgi:hypothetical protein